MANNSHEFKDFLLKLIPECADAPMQLMVRGNMGMTIELSKNSQIYFHSIDQSADLNVVMIKLDSATSTPPEITFSMQDSDLLRLQKVSVLPVIHM
ncbi:hypothetical protein F6X00_25435 (plasmid) [Vibrio vulnificus]|jgi:hypothetical protein|uniref:hypothetical protein n=1 Tax=Vibrio TaxID=662 RepID=UPI0005EDA0F3|nr:MULTISPECIES: hypothetical protein [Vibrio]QMV39740.1 hypothetical protein F6X00_25435 [Vibrio vulnificus]